MRDVEQRPSHIGRNQVEDARGAGREALDAHGAVEEHGRDLAGREEVLQIVAVLGTVLQVLLQVVVDRGQLLVDRLQLLLAGLQLLRGGAQLLVERLQLLVGSAQRLVGRTQGLVGTVGFVDGRVQLRVKTAQLVLRLEGEFGHAQDVFARCQWCFLEPHDQPALGRLRMPHVLDGFDGHSYGERLMTAYQAHTS